MSVLEHTTYVQPGILHWMYKAPAPVSGRTYVLRGDLFRNRQGRQERTLAFIEIEDPDIEEKWPLGLPSSS